MNGAESLVGTLLEGNVDVCFTNPGTSEMHFVAALDKYDKMRSILCLFEGCATGAADGYFRMKRTPASTLLHLGPGLANGLANLHNAKKASSGIVNIVGEHALDHIKLNAPLTSDIEGIARPVSHWVKTSKSSKDIAVDGAEAIEMANVNPGQISTLILPGDTAWNEGNAIQSINLKNKYSTVSSNLIDEALTALREAKNPLILVGGSALEEKNLIKLLSKYRKGSGYDCIVPGSGGKDSAFTAHILKYKYGMNPLTVTWAPHLYTDIGWKNFTNWMHVGGLDNLLFTPNGKLHKFLTKLAFENLLHPFQPFIIGQRIIGPKIAEKFNIPLVIYGENQAEYGNAIEENTNPIMNMNFFS